MKDATILTRIFVNAEGDLIVTDLWEEVRAALQPYFEDPDRLPENAGPRGPRTPTGERFGETS